MEAHIYHKYEERRDTEKLCLENITTENIFAYVLVHKKGTRIHQHNVKTPSAYDPNQNFNAKKKI